MISEPVRKVELREGEPVEGTRSIFNGVLHEIELYEEREGKKAFFEKQSTDDCAGPDNITTILDAVRGTFGGEKTTETLEHNLATGLDTSEFLQVAKVSTIQDPIGMIREWLDIKSKDGKKLRHSDLFGFMLETHRGNVSAALRDTMLFFHSELRERPKRRMVIKIGDSTIDAEIFANFFEPINPDNAIPVGGSNDPDKDINNRMGEFYHQYWILYLLNKYPPNFVKLMLSTEYLLFGSRHGKIKKEQDEALIQDFMDGRTSWKGERPRLGNIDRVSLPLAEVVLGDIGRCQLFQDDNILTEAGTHITTTKELVVLDDGIFYIDSTHDLEGNNAHISSIVRCRFPLPEEMRNGQGKLDGEIDERSSDEQKHRRDIVVLEHIAGIKESSSVTPEDKIDIIQRYIELYRPDLADSQIIILSPILGNQQSGQ